MVKYTSDKTEFNRRKRQSQIDRSRWSPRYYPTSYTSLSTARLSTSALRDETGPIPINEIPEDTVVETYKGEEADISTMDQKPQTSDTLVGLGGLFNNPKYADIRVFLGECQYKLYAHRIVLGLSSPYFDHAFQNNFKECEEGEFRFRKYSLHALWRVFQYMYESDYSEDTPLILEDQDVDDLELLKHPRVFAIADMFQMDKLKALAVEKFRTQLKEHWISDTFPDCIREVYSTTPPDDRTMAGVVAEVARANIDELSRRPAFQHVVKDVGDFAVDLLLNATLEPTATQNHEIHSKRYCRNCGNYL